MQTIILVTLLALLVVSGLSQQTTCKKLHIGSRSDPNTISDIVKNGVPSKRWAPDADFPYLTSTIRDLDYFYLVDVGLSLNESNVNLFYDKTEHVNSSFTLKKEEEGYYTIAVNYVCDSYGANVITFNLEIEAPGCGGTEISWKKLCGNPYQERSGFSVVMGFGNFKEKIIQNGKLVNARYFDQDINDYAVSIPTFINSINFSLYLDTDDIQKC